MILFAKRLLGKDNGVDEKKKQAADEAMPENKAAISKENIKDQEPINIADLSKPPVEKKRNIGAKKAHLARVMKLLGVLSKKAKTTDDIEKYFAKIIRRYRLKVLEYAKGEGGKLGIHVKINPDKYFFSCDTNIIVKADDGDESVPTNLIKNKTKTYNFESINTASGNKEKHSFSAGSIMTAEYLSFDHPEGKKTSSTELKKPFKYLVSGTLKGKTTEFKYVRGHLLNHHIGGLAIDDNLFPITAKANSDHLSKIETDAKNRVNKKRELVHYKVEVDKYTAGINSDDITYINSDFICTLGTYDLDCKNSEKGGLKKSKKKKVVTIHSRYSEKPQPRIESEIDNIKGVKRGDFDPSKINIKSKNQKIFLSSLNKQQLLSLPGMNDETIVNKMLEGKEKPNIKNMDKLISLIGVDKAEQLKKDLPKRTRKNIGFFSIR